ncbi:MAG: hypothetical protein FWC43_11450 [Planctomycetaceae bacterium]|nr:hypothetical protein [Planctomycetaceae bacterium]
MIEITCHTADKLPLDEITEFQGDLKKRTSKDTEKIIESIYDNGFSFPFFIWKKEDTNFCLDGHGRLGALNEMRTRGETIPDLPVVYVDADDEREARIKLLQINSQYGRIDPDALESFIGNFDIDFSKFQLLDLAKSSFIFEPSTTEKREVINIFGHKIPCSHQERQQVVDYLHEYNTKHRSYLGVISRLFGTENSVEYGTFVENVDIDTIAGADYNPREIEKKKILTLAESIEYCGFCRPVMRLAASMSDLRRRCRTRMVLPGRWGVTENGSFKSFIAATSYVIYASKTGWRSFRLLQTRR